MIDREKVILGLECCSQQYGGPELCEQCPYYSEPFPCSNELLRDVLAVLKEQDAVTPKLEDALIPVKYVPLKIRWKEIIKDTWNRLLMIFKPY